MPLLREVLADARRDRGLTQEALAALVGKETHWVYNREQGKAAITLKDAALIADALKLTDAEWRLLRSVAA